MKTAHKLTTKNLKAETSVHHDPVTGLDREIQWLRAGIKRARKCPMASLEPTIGFDELKLRLSRWSHYCMPISVSTLFLEFREHHVENLEATTR